MRRPTARTLRGQILLLSTGITALVLILAGVPLALLLTSSAYAEAEREATESVQNVADYLSAGSYNDDALVEYLSRVNARARWPVTVVMSDGDVLGAPLSPAARAAITGSSSSRVDGDGDELGTSRTVSIDDGRLVEVRADDGRGQATVLADVTEADVRSALLRKYAILAASALALLVLAVAAAEITSRRLVRPLRQTAATAGRLSTGDLTARAPENGPDEVAQVAVELNALAGRIDELLTAERESTADLSHRLRTPLTALRLGVESLPTSERKTELELQVAALERTLTQVIRAARRPQREGVHPLADAVAVVRDRLDFWTPLAEDQERHLTTEVPQQPAWVRSSADDLATTLDALLENVMAHTSEGTAFALRLFVQESTVRIEVSDEGPGVPAGALSRGQSDRGSSGLGLDIARSATEAVGGTLTIERTNDVTIVCVTLQRVGAPPTG